MLKEHRCLKLDEDKTENSIQVVVEEVPLSIFINGRHYVTAMISPSMRKEFVIGHLFSERIVRFMSEIESLEIEGNLARTIVTNPMRTILPRRPIVSGCGGISSFLDESKLPEIRSDEKIERGDIYKAMKIISQSKLHETTGGSHTVGLLGKDGATCISEDIGRHNALDKVIGCGLIQGTNFSKTFTVSSGRISSDMALKCSVAGIPVIVSRGATTSLAISIAQRTGLSIIGFARGNRMKVYSHPWRVEGLDIEIT